MASSIESKRRLRAIRRLSASFPDRTAEERLARIEGIASGAVDPVVRNTTSPDLMERLAAGQASRSPRTAHDKRPGAKRPADTPRHADDLKRADDPDKKKRKKGGGHDRQESGGLNRSADVNG